MSNYDDIKDWHKSTILENICDKLKKRDFDSLVLNSIDDICDYIMASIPNDATVGLGGSVTIRETSIDAMLKKRGNIVFDNWDKELDVEQKAEARRKSQAADFFLTSLNAITMDGQIVNIDGIGNRVSSMIFGPQNVIAVAGSNKIASNIEEAIWRIKNIVTPKNSKRLGLDTPCATKGHCLNCKPPKTICRITTILDYRPALTNFTVLLTPLELGF